MLTQAQSLTLPSLLPTCSSFTSKSTISFPPPHLKKPIFTHSTKPPSLKTSFQALRCSLSTVSELKEKMVIKKPCPAEVCRTIVELSSSGTLSTVTQQGWPIGTGVHFAVDSLGTPILCLNSSNKQFLSQERSSLHVQLEQRGLRTIQCMLQGSLNKPEDKMVLEKLKSIWKKKFEEEVDQELLYLMSVERVLQIEDLKEKEKMFTIIDIDLAMLTSQDGVWVTSAEYKCASPDPLRDFAEKIVSEINMNHMEDFERVCNIYLDLEFKVADANLIWVDRLGFDVHIRSRKDEIFESRIPFPREVSDEKGVKSSFNCMAQHAWEVERNLTPPDFEKSKFLKQIR
ncbi:hypothetical protein IFM89_010135 [Coptis chinensis]|uniref:DUF2470 domain-containing protein n=1 Tax=Coptis chinensis TaxID=261450 RepID=A0A835IDB0_9MAGN|nr:hypothetical protein IFM89_010135 [Coptis chinensis]